MVLLNLQMLTGSNTITARLKSDKLELVNGTNLEVWW